jgi:hypothetical protein
MPKRGVFYSHKPWLYKVCRKQAYFIATNRGYIRYAEKRSILWPQTVAIRMPKRGVFYSHKPWLYGFRKHAGEFYRLYGCRKQEYFIATNRGYIRYAEKRSSL